MARNHLKTYCKGTEFDLTETCEMIAWYLSGAVNKDICAAYDITWEGFRHILIRYNVPRKASDEQRKAISKAARFRAYDNRASNIHPRAASVLPHHSTSNPTLDVASRTDHL